MTKGKIISYVLRLEGDDHNPFYIYCGHTRDGEIRMLQHTGAAPGGAAFCALHEPTEIISAKIHDSLEEALVAETMNWNLWAGKLKDYDLVRGGRLNGPGPLKYRPRGWALIKTPNPE